MPIAAGMLAAINPCGFALLPAYLSLLILGDDEPTKSRAVLRALRLTAAMSLGFATVFAIFGLAIAPVAAGVQKYLPWFTVVLGLGLVLMGVALLLGKTLTLPRFSRSRSGPGKPITASFGSMFGFGASYALASLTCTIAPFLVVVVSGFRQESWAVGAALFIAYAAGMGVVVGTVAVTVALAHDAIVNGIRRTGPWFNRISGLLLLLCGAYVAYYGWWEITEGPATDPVISAAADIQHTLVEWVQRLSPLGWLVLGSALVLVGAFSRRRRSSRAGRD